MWARVKGKTENDLIALFAHAYMFRPGYIHPERGVTSRTGWIRVLVTLLRPIGFVLKQFPGVGTSTDVVGTGDDRRRAQRGAVARGRDSRDQSSWAGAPRADSELCRGQRPSSRNQCPYLRCCQDDGTGPVRPGEGSRATMASTKLSWVAGVTFGVGGLCGFVLPSVAFANNPEAKFESMDTTATARSPRMNTRRRPAGCSRRWTPTPTAR